MRPDAIRLVEVEIPLRRPLRTARGKVTSRRTVLVGAVAGSVVGWGEAAPYPGLQAETVDDVWEALCAGGEPPPTGAAALAEACADLAARLAGEPLWRRLGGRPDPVPAGVALGIGPDLLARAAEAVAAGYRAIKLKIAPGVDLDPLRRLRERFPALTVGLDANGGYRWSDLPTLRRLDALAPAYLEQPFPAADLAAHARLREELTTPVALDEYVDSPGAAEEIVAAGAADLLVVKPGRLGPEGCRAVHDVAVAAGLHIRASGLLETGIGRAHTLAVATLSGVVSTDVAAAGFHAAIDPVAPALRPENGVVTPPAGPGLGVAPDPGLLAEVARRRETRVVQ